MISPADEWAPRIRHFRFHGSTSRPVDIAYTNAGARAIVSTASLPMLIIVGTAPSEIQWLDKSWNCAADF